MENPLDRQAVINRVHDHFIVQRKPAGRQGESSHPVYHGRTLDGQEMACAIGLFDTGDDYVFTEEINKIPLYELFHDLIERAFGRELTCSDVNFLIKLQCENDVAIRHAKSETNLTDKSFDDCFVEELTHRLDRFCREQVLKSPCTRTELAYTA